MVIFSGHCLRFAFVTMSTRDHVSIAVSSQQLACIISCKFLSSVYLGHTANCICSSFTKSLIAGTCGCTQVAAGLTEAALAASAGAVRIMLFVGGPITEGGGQVVGKELQEPIRSHKAPTSACCLLIHRNSCLVPASLPYLASTSDHITDASWLRLGAFDISLCDAMLRWFRHYISYLCQQ